MVLVNGICTYSICVHGVRVQQLLVLYEKEKEVHQMMNTEHQQLLKEGGLLYTSKVSIRIGLPQQNISL